MSLHHPITFRCGATAPNRVALAPLTNTQSHADGVLSEDEYRWLVRRAEGGFGIVSTCAAFVSEEGHAWQGQLGVASSKHLEGLTRLAKGLKQHGAIAIVQLHHGGDKADQAPEKLSTGGPDGARAATAEDLARVQEDFVAAALRCQEAGFDGVEVHGANGYLFTQFLAPLDNPRTDAWGGDLAGRAKLLRDTVRAVREAVRPDFIVGVRLSPVDSWTTRGLVLSDGVQVSCWMAEDGVDFVHLSLQDASGPAQHEDSGTIVATAVREALPDEVVLFAAGGMWTREDAERAVEVGVDVPALGRVGIIHPDWVKVSSEPSWQPTRPPWTAEGLRAVDVGPDLIRYLGKFRGMVAGERPASG